jgi:hypothetical protein
MLSQIVQRPGEPDVGGLVRRVDRKRLTVTRRSFPHAPPKAQEIGEIAAEFQLSRLKRDARAQQSLTFVNVPRLFAYQPEQVRRSGIARHVEEKSATCGFGAVQIVLLQE